ncbi:CFEM domain-containing protein [Phlyctema vagabunda]|uniref:CFEM domain-containing protein n=1 Tax=Phlyctema vagabunda TaxID=108571 RepID=A0ABR4PV72_9HELO
MRTTILICILSLVTIVIANTSPTTNLTLISEELSKISSCGLRCLTNVIPAGGCALTDYTCICSNKRIQDHAASWMQANCTLAESLQLSRTNAAICQIPYETKLPMLITMTIICSTLAWGSIIARLATRFILHQKYGLDDLFIALTLVAGIAFTALGICAFHKGFGSHVWTLSVEDAEKDQYWFYILEILYIIHVGLIKLSLVFLYLRIFSSSKSFRLSCYLTVAFVACYIVAFTLISVFQCRPISYAWDKYTQKGQCINFATMSWWNAGVSILQDFIIVLLPCREVWQLHMSLQRKLAICCMFGVGSFSIAMSLARLTALSDFGVTGDPTWDNVPATFWSTLEVSAAAICANMSVLRAGVMACYQRLTKKGAAGASSSMSDYHLSKAGHETSTGTKTQLSTAPATTGADASAGTDVEMGKLEFGVEKQEVVHSSTRSLSDTNPDSQSGVSDSAELIGRKPGEG